MVKGKSKSKASTRSKARPRAASRKRASRSGAQLRGTIQKGKAAVLQHIPWSTVVLEALNPLLQRQMVFGKDVMIARILLKKGCIVPDHSHHNEQLSYMLEGALRFDIDGREIVVRAGEVLCIPSNMPHGAEALEDSLSLDVFSPPRADWINKTDQYLRGKK